MPLLPPPMPPFSKSESGYGSSSVYSDVYSTPTSANYGEWFFNTQSTLKTRFGTITHLISFLFTVTDTNASSYDSSAAYQPSDDYNTSTYDTQIPTYNAAAVPYDASVEPAYVNDNSSYDGVANPWEPTEQQSWVDPPLNSDTPESPPIFEKEAYTEPIEYHDTVDHGNGGGDVDHRVLPALNSPAVGGSKYSIRETSTWKYALTSKHNTFTRMQTKQSITACCFYIVLFFDNLLVDILFIFM